jgi:hypothetical protein
MTIGFKSRHIAWLLIASACVMSATDMVRTGMQYTQAQTEVLDLMEDKEVRRQQADARRQRVQGEQVAPPPMLAVRIPWRPPILIEPFAVAPFPSLASAPPLIRAPPTAAPVVA